MLGGSKDNLSRQSPSWCIYSNNWSHPLSISRLESVSMALFCLQSTDNFRSWSYTHLDLRYFGIEMLRYQDSNNHHLIWNTEMRRSVVDAVRWSTTLTNLDTFTSFHFNKFQSYLFKINLYLISLNWKNLDPAQSYWNSSICAFRW